MTLSTQCACGRVSYAVEGRPIVGAVCYCDDCQAGGRQIEALPGAPAIHDADGGTPYLLFRKDRVRCLQGEDLLRDYRLKDGAPTRRVVAACCNTGLFADFEKGHWLSLYRARFQGEAPLLEMSVQTQFKTDGPPRADLPAYSRWPPKFMFRLLLAVAAKMVGR